MASIKSTIGYIVAFSTIILAVATWVNNGMVGKSIVQRANLKVSPNMNGGSIRKTIDYDGYRVVIHEPVFVGLLKPKEKGFIQIDLIKDQNAPTMISQDIDFDDDQKIDFNIQYNTNTHHTEVISYHADEPPDFMPVKRKSAFTIRVNLTNPDL